MKDKSRRDKQSIKFLEEQRDRLLASGMRKQERCEKLVELIFEKLSDEDIRLDVYEIVKGNKRLRGMYFD